MALCPTCGGTGKVTCTCCLGKTTMAVCSNSTCPTYPYPPETRTMCWSYGTCPACGGALVAYGTCTTCGGTGTITCPECGGSGEIPEPSLNLDCIPSSGYVGDTFTFLGSFLVNDHWLPGRHIDLVLNGKIVGSGTTDSYGDYRIEWVADEPGTLTFHTEAAYP